MWAVDSEAELEEAADTKDWYSWWRWWGQCLSKYGYWTCFKSNKYTDCYFNKAFEGCNILCYAPPNKDCHTQWRISFTTELVLPLIKWYHTISHPEKNNLGWQHRLDNTVLTSGNLSTISLWSLALCPNPKERSWIIAWMLPCQCSMVQSCSWPHQAMDCKNWRFQQWIVCIDMHWHFNKSSQINMHWNQIQWFNCKKNWTNFASLLP